MGLRGDPGVWSRFPEESAAYQQGKPRLVAYHVCSRGPVALENSGVGVGGGHLTSRCWQRGTRTGGFSQMGLRALVLASHRRCWVQPGTELWCLVGTTGCSDHRASWCEAWPIPLSREQLVQDRRLAAGCQTPILGHSRHHSLPHAQPRPMHPPLQLHDP